MTMENSSYFEYRISQFFSIFVQFGYKITSHSTILDFGCGDGGIVNYLRKADYLAYGCDIHFKRMPYTEELERKNFIKRIDFENYRIPFDDNTFDFIISDQVFEHVQNYDTSIAEIKRVLKPGGACLHFFPSRYSIIEPHVKVPFGTIISSYWWLNFWANMGIRKNSQKGWSAKMVAKDNFDYLNSRTIYLQKKLIRHFFSNHFEMVTFCEKQFLRTTSLVKKYYWIRLIILNSYFSYLYSRFKGRVVLAIKG